jgi:6-pyruvoyltetrahydropterin/6-carboxytetrahydropterin synthase
VNAVYRIEITHNFETAHRLSNPDAPTKCRSIHGHSWWATVTLAGPELDARGMLVEFGAFKKAWRGFLDDQVDHHLAVREGDPVAAAILSVQPDARVLQLPEDPSTEFFARWVHERTAEILARVDPSGLARVERVHIQETRVNAASYSAP